MKLLLHPSTKNALDIIMRNPAGAVIFDGSRGLGKAVAARQLTTRLNCPQGGDDNCQVCRQIEAGTFPGYIMVNRGEKTTISIERVRSLTSELTLKPYTSGTRVVVIDEAHLLTPEAQNALLKLLEDSPDRHLIILIAEQLETLLLTVRSRCRLVHFTRPGEEVVTEFLVNSRGVASNIATQAAAAAGGVPGLAITLAAQPTELTLLLELNATAGRAQSHSTFERLLLAMRLITSGADLERFGEALHASTIARTIAGEVDPNTAAASLGALELFRKQLRAKIAPRVALERLMLELG